MRTLPKTVVVTVAIMLLRSPEAACQTSHDAPVIDRPRLLAIVASVRRAILTEDVRALLASISQVEPLACTDSTYSLEKVSAFLRDKSSHLYISLFDTPTFSKRCGREYPPECPAISERDFLRSARDSVQVDRLNEVWVAVTLTSPVRTHYLRKWYLHWESGAWKLAGGSLVIGNCSCG